LHRDVAFRVDHAKLRHRLEHAEDPGDAPATPEQALDKVTSPAILFLARVQRLLGVQVADDIKPQDLLAEGQQEWRQVAPAIGHDAHHERLHPRQIPAARQRGVARGPVDDRDHQHVGHRHVGQVVRQLVQQLEVEHVQHDADAQPHLVERAGWWEVHGLRRTHGRRRRSIGRADALHQALPAQRAQDACAAPGHGPGAAPPATVPLDGRPGKRNGGADLHGKARCNAAAAAAGEKYSRTFAMPLADNCAQSAGSACRRVTAATKSAGACATRTSTPARSCIPSIAMGVAMTGTPWLMAMLILPFTPAPKRSGAIEARQPSSHGVSSATRPWQARPGRSSSRRTAAGMSPSKCTVMSGKASRSGGRISAAIQRMASRLGAWLHPPMKNRSLRPPYPGARSSTSWMLDSSSTYAVGASVASSARSCGLTTKLTSAAAISPSSLRRVASAWWRSWALAVNSAARCSRRKCRSTVSNSNRACGAWRRTRSAYCPATVCRHSMTARSSWPWSRSQVGRSLSVGRASNSQPSAPSVATPAESTRPSSGAKPTLQP